MTRVYIFTFLLFALAGCAQTPAQVAATEPIFTIPISAPPDSVARCLVNALENEFAGWAFSVRNHSGHPRVQAHAGPEQGTVLVVDVSEAGAKAHLSRNTLVTDQFRKFIASKITGCNVR